MVVFTCNNCGDSLQKPKVAKHYQFQCRKPISLTCVDCLNDFLNDEYVSHTKCITEAERYGGKDFVLKTSVKKGEKKQQEWIHIVNDVLTSSGHLSQNERIFLQSISKYQNIPRKKVKYLNFIKNALGYKVDFHIAESCWEKMESAYKEKNDIQKCNQSDQTNNNDFENVIKNSNEIAYNNDHSNVRNSFDHVIEKSDKIERRKRTNKNATIDANNIEVNESKSKKRKRANPEVTSERYCFLKPVDNYKQFKKIEGLCSKNMRNIDDCEQNEDNRQLCKKNEKFRWKPRILQVFESQKEIPLKKLRRKVIKQYLSEYTDSSKDQIEAKFNKKLRKISELNVIDDVVKLKL